MEAIYGWLTLKTEPVLNGTIGPQEDWIDNYELRRMIPGDPKIELVRSWLYFHGILHYKSGRTTLFRRQEIEAWIERSQKYGLGDFWAKKRMYKEKNRQSFIYVTLFDCVIIEESCEIEYLCMLNNKS